MPQPIEPWNPDRWDHPDETFFLIDEHGWAVPFEHGTERTPELAARRRLHGRSTAVPRWAAALAGAILIAAAPNAVAYGQDAEPPAEDTPTDEGPAAASGPIEVERGDDDSIDWTPELVAEIESRRSAHDPLADGSLDGIGYADSYGVGEAADDRIDPPEYVDETDRTHVSRRSQISNGLGAVAQANPEIGSRYAVVGSSGATAEDVYAPQPEIADDPEEGARNYPMADMAPLGDMDFLAFSLGGNDAGFAPLVDFLANNFAWTDNDVTREEYEQFLDDTGFGEMVAPLSSEELAALAERPLDPASPILTERLAAVMRDRVLANPTAVPMISTYPEAVDPDFPLDEFLINLTAEELGFFLEHAQNLNESIRAAAELCGCGAVVVEQSDALEGREYNTPESAIADIIAREQQFPGEAHRNQEAVHPNLAGTDLLGDRWGRVFAETFGLEVPDPDAEVRDEFLPELYVPERPPEGQFPIPDSPPPIDFETSTPVPEPISFTPEPEAQPQPEGDAGSEPERNPGQPTVVVVVPVPVPVPAPVGDAEPEAGAPTDDAGSDGDADADKQPPTDGSDSVPGATDPESDPDPEPGGPTLEPSGDDVPGDDDTEAGEDSTEAEPGADEDSTNPDDSEPSQDDNDAGLEERPDQEIVRPESDEDRDDEDDETEETETEDEVEDEDEDAAGERPDDGAVLPEEEDPEDDSDDDRDGEDRDEDDDDGDGEGGGQTPADEVTSPPSVDVEPPSQPAPPEPSSPPDAPTPSEPPPSVSETPPSQPTPPAPDSPPTVDTTPPSQPSAPDVDDDVPEPPSDGDSNDDWDGDFDSDPEPAPDSPPTVDSTPPSQPSAPDVDDDVPEPPSDGDSNDDWDGDFDSDPEPPSQPEPPAPDSPPSVDTSPPDNPGSSGGHHGIGVSWGGDNDSNDNDSNDNDNSSNDNDSPAESPSSGNNDNDSPAESPSSGNNDSPGPGEGSMDAAAASSQPDPSSEPGPGEGSMDAAAASSQPDPPSPEPGPGEGSMDAAAASSQPDPDPYGGYYF